MLEGLVRLLVECELPHLHTSPRTREPLRFPSPSSPHPAAPASPHNAQPARSHIAPAQPAAHKRSARPPVHPAQWRPHNGAAPTRRSVHYWFGLVWLFEGYMCTRRQSSANLPWRAEVYRAELWSSGPTALARRSTGEQACLRRVSCPRFLAPSRWEHRELRFYS